MQSGWRCSAAQLSLMLGIGMLWGVNQINQLLESLQPAANHHSSYCDGWIILWVYSHSSCQNVLGKKQNQKQANPTPEHINHLTHFASTTLEAVPLTVVLSCLQGIITSRRNWLGMITSSGKATVRRADLTAAEDKMSWWKKIPAISQFKWINSNIDFH